MRFAKIQNITKRPKTLLGFLLFTSISIALYYYLSLFWPYSVVFSRLNFVKVQGSIQEVYKDHNDWSYKVSYVQDLKKGSTTISHRNYFTDVLEKGDTLTVYMSSDRIRIPQADGIDTYVWFLLFCFGICVYIAALLFKNLIIPN